MKRVALYPGSFDPLTVGHMDIIERLAKLYDEVVVAVLVNPAKTPYLPADARAVGITRSVAHLSNVSVRQSSGAAVDLAREVGAQVMVRGLRSVTDFEYETTIAAGYRYMAPEIETLFIPAKPEHGAVSSSLVRQIHAVGGDVSALVPAAVLRTLDERDARKEIEL